MALPDPFLSYCFDSFRRVVLIFPKETTSTIVFRLLDRVIAAELIPTAIEKQIGPYMAHHGLNRDTMLLEYIKVGL